jgi:hypothetical protein
MAVGLSALSYITILVLTCVRGCDEGLGQLGKKKSNDLNGNRTRDLPDCGTVPHPTTLPCTHIAISVLSSMSVEKTNSVVRVPGCRSRGPGLIPGATRSPEVVGLERGPIHLRCYLKEKVAALVKKTEIKAVVDPQRSLCDTSPQKLALTSPTSGGRSVGIVRSRTNATELSLYIYTPSALLH